MTQASATARSGMPRRAAASCNLDRASPNNSACRRSSLIEAAIFTRSNPSCSGAAARDSATSRRLASEPCPLLIELSQRLRQVGALCGLQPMRSRVHNRLLPQHWGTRTNSRRFTQSHLVASSPMATVYATSISAKSPEPEWGTTRTRWRAKPQVRRCVSAIANTGRREPAANFSGFRMRVPDGAPAAILCTASVKSADGTRGSVGGAGDLRRSRRDRARPVVLP